MVHEEDTKKRLIAVLGTFSAMAAFPISLTLGMYIINAALEMHTIGIILGTIILTVQLLAVIPLMAALSSRRYNEAFEALMAVLITESAVILKLPIQDTYIIPLAYLILILSTGIGIIFDFKLIAASAFILTLYVLSSNLPLLSTTIVLLLIVLVRMRYKVICKKAAFLFVISLAISTVASEHFNLAKLSLYFPLVLLALDVLERNKLSCDYGKNLKNNVRDVLKQYLMIIYSVLGFPPDISVDLPAIMTSLVLMTSYTLIYSLLDEEERSKNSQT